ncbi:hypothetical protein SKAU_G00162690 [Synaphobranchus kaupii]|uniref:Uncharacterized protein n=1 Tax=Synaphobranchus kaupii TaxID=118154 RepID=A0A9Q1IXT9_SYNKA|nr:hypothetical protein SKAU_G00162690 [Synaphobranchus kaupii]
MQNQARGLCHRYQGSEAPALAGSVDLPTPTRPLLGGGGGLQPDSETDGQWAPQDQQLDTVRAAQGDLVGVLALDRCSLVTQLQGRRATGRGGEESIVSSQWGNNSTSAQARGPGDGTTASEDKSAKPTTELAVTEDTGGAQHPDCPAKQKCTCASGGRGKRLGGGWH